MSPRVRTLLLLALVAAIVGAVCWMGFDEGTGRALGGEGTPEDDPTQTESLETALALDGTNVATLAGRGDGSEGADAAPRLPPISTMTWEALWLALQNADKEVAAAARARIAALHEGGALDLEQVLASYLALDALPPALEHGARGRMGTQTHDAPFMAAARQDLPAVLAAALARSGPAMIPALALLTRLQLAEEDVPAALALLEANPRDPRVLSALFHAAERLGPPSLPLILPFLNGLLDHRDEKVAAGIRGDALKGGLRETHSWDIRRLLVGAGPDAVPLIYIALDPYKDAARPGGPWRAHGSSERSPLCMALCLMRESAEDELAELLRRGDKELRWDILYHLGELKGEHPPEVLRAALEVARDPKRADNWIAVARLGNQGEAVRAYLVATLKHEGTLMRNGAADALADLGVTAPATIDHLLPMLTNDGASIYGSEALAAILTAPRLTRAQAKEFAKALPLFAYGQMRRVSRDSWQGAARLVAEHPEALYDGLRAGDHSAFTMLSYIDAPDDLHQVLCGGHTRHKNATVRLVAASVSGQSLDPIKAALLSEDFDDFPLALRELRRHGALALEVLPEMVTAYGVLQAEGLASGKRVLAFEAMVLQAFEERLPDILQWSGPEETKLPRGALARSAFSPPDAAMFPLLSKALSDRRVFVRLRAARILERFPRVSPKLRPRVQELLAPALGDTSLEVAALAAMALADRAEYTSGVANAALAALASDDEDITERSAGTLETIAGRSGPTVRAKLRGRLAPLVPHRFDKTSVSLEHILAVLDGTDE